MQIIQNRRRFLAGLSAAASASLVRVEPTQSAEQTETTTVRLPRWNDGGYCWAASYYAGELLRAEGFTDVRYVQGDPNADNTEWLAHDVTDFDLNMPTMHIATIDAGAPITVLTGLHIGCFELIGNDSVNSITDMKGKRVGVWALNSHPHVLMKLMAAYVGLDPVNDIHWVESGKVSPSQLFVEGKVDAILSAAPEPQQLRIQNIGHTIVSNGVDRPWSQYFCCMIAGRAEYVTKYPVATKRVLRAILKAADLCVSAPNLVARQLVDRGFLPDYEYALLTLNEIKHDKWREYDPADSLRFYTLRMQEIGMIKSSPQKILADGADWRFLNELKRELKT